jgi:hypothetical protein
MNKFISTALLIASLVPLQSFALTAADLDPSYSDQLRAMSSKRFDEEVASVYGQIAINCGGGAIFGYADSAFIGALMGTVTAITGIGETALYYPENHMNTNHPEFKNYGLTKAMFAQTVNLVENNASDLRKSDGCDYNIAQAKAILGVDKEPSQPSPLGSVASNNESGLTQVKSIREGSELISCGIEKGEMVCEHTNVGSPVHPAQ